MLPQVKMTAKPSHNLRVNLSARLKFSEILSLPETEFAKLIGEIENDPIFQKLIYPQDAGPKAVFRKRFPHSRLNQNFYELNEEISPSNQGVDVQTLMLKHK